MRVQWPAMASSTELSTTSQTRWCRPAGPVEPMYMPGRLRTCLEALEDGDVLGAVGRRWSGPRRGLSATDAASDGDATAAGRRPRNEVPRSEDAIAMDHRLPDGGR